jgi:Mitochondrial glycoprotein
VVCAPEFSGKISSFGSSERWCQFILESKVPIPSPVKISILPTTTRQLHPFNQASSIFYNIPIMMSLRAIARAAPRALTRASTSAAVRSQAAIRTSSLLRTTQSSFLRPQQASAFSTSVFRRSQATTETDEELSAKLASEIEFEQDVKENEPVPASVKEFLDNGPFEIIDTPGKEEVVLTRTYGNEK